MSAKQSSIDALYYIATLPEPERTKEHTTSSGETKTPDEMTVRELRELKKQLKQRDEQNAQLQSQIKEREQNFVYFNTHFGEDYNGALRLYGKHKTHQLTTMPKEQLEQPKFYSGANLTASLNLELNAKIDIYKIAYIYLK